MGTVGTKFFWPPGVEAKFFCRLEADRKERGPPSSGTPAVGALEPPPPPLRGPQKLPNGDPPRLGL